ncbi:hypothetical protein SUNI508_04606 [Seiridium unicorne]|uniref:CFEM domain-containing protein n=1 Tax=Seiridium unicorne TaxID=138068 RepID=A0ABR2V8Q9_9PEZI
MKFSVTVLALAGAATASTIADFVPECAVSCLEDGVSSSTPCAVDDLTCVCVADNYRATYTAALSCVLAACGADTAIGEVLPGATHMCEVVLSSTFTSVAPSTTATTPSSTLATEVPASTTEISTSVAITAATTPATTSYVSTSSSSAASTTTNIVTAGAAYTQKSFGMISCLVFGVLAWI